MYRKPSKLNRMSDIDWMLIRGQIPERAIFGWPAIGGMFNKTSQAMIRRKKELLSCGVIFYTWVGRPKHRRVAAFPTMLVRWASIKSLKGEMV